MFYCEVCTTDTICIAVFGGHHPYLRARASTNAPLCRQKPCSSRGNVVNQLEEPFSFARSMAFLRVGVSNYRQTTIQTDNYTRGRPRAPRVTSKVTHVIRFFFFVFLASSFGE